MALSAEADYVLRTIEERGIRFVRLWFTDVLGFLKSFTITSQELEGAFTEGMGFDGSSIEGFSRIQESDMIAIPDPATFQLIPWQTEQAVARMFCDIYDPDGTPFDGDPRGVLKRQLQRASDLGFTFYVGPELEFFYFKSVDDPTSLDQGGYFDETPLDVATDYRKRTVLYLESMGIPVEYVHHEVAPSQHEIDLRYSDALTMADNVMTYRLTVKEVAQEFGIYATFMPKPIAGVNGSGMHTHQSLFEGDRNAFFDATDEYHLSKTAKAYIAGILRHAPEITLVTNQWVNSYKRLVPGFEAPVYVCWARRNRSALVRVPLYKPGKEGATRIEYRSPDPACNPYLAFAAMLAAGLAGIEGEYELPPEASNNIYEMTGRGARRRRDPFAARGPARGDPAGRRLHRAARRARRARPRVPDPQQAPGVGRLQGVRDARTRWSATSRSSRPILCVIRALSDFRRVDARGTLREARANTLPGREQMTKGSSRLRRPVLTTLTTTLVLTGMLIGAPAANAAVLTQSLGVDLTPTQLAAALVGSGVTVSNAQFTGANAAGGTFSGGGTGASAIVGLRAGSGPELGRHRERDRPEQPHQCHYGQRPARRCQSGRPPSGGSGERRRGRVDVQLRPRCVERVVQVRVLV